MADAPLIEDLPPDGFLRVDFDRGRPDPTFNGHIGTLYAKRGTKGSRDEFVLGFRVQGHMCNPAGGLHGGMMMTVADLPYQNQAEYTAATNFVSAAPARMLATRQKNSKPEVMRARNDSAIRGNRM